MIFSEPMVLGEWFKPYLVETGNAMPTKRRYPAAGSFPAHHRFTIFFINHNAAKE